MHSLAASNHQPMHLLPLLYAEPLGMQHALPPQLLQCPTAMPRCNPTHQPHLHPPSLHHSTHRSPLHPSTPAGRVVAILDKSPKRERTAGFLTAAGDSTFLLPLDPKLPAMQLQPGFPLPAALQQEVASSEVKNRSLVMGRIVDWPATSTAPLVLVTGDVIGMCGTWVAPLSLPASRALQCMATHDSACCLHQRPTTIL
jgi:hypothetical protein